jgi:hypothetical protein
LHFPVNGWKKSWVPYLALSATPWLIPSDSGLNHFTGHMSKTVSNDWLEVAYACECTQKLIRINYREMTAEQAIERSGILKCYTEIDLAANKIGIYGKKVRLSQRLKPGDRVEIYRPLLLNPKQARRRRAMSDK